MSSNPKLVFAGEIAQIAGVISGVAGVVLSLHHWPAAAALIGGAAAFLWGRNCEGCRSGNSCLVVRNESRPHERQSKDWPLHRTRWLTGEKSSAGRSPARAVH